MQLEEEFLAAIQQLVTELSNLNKTLVEIKDNTWGMSQAMHNIDDHVSTLNSAET